MNIKLLIGLGNPGDKFKKTRHNVGFLAVDFIAFKIQSSNWRTQANFNAEISEGMIDSEKIMLVKPQTFMNESGKAVKAIADYYKINIDNILVIHDDLDIALGKYKIARDRTSAGHKGVQSIIDHLGTKDFTRIRIGIEMPECNTPTEKFVLENFSKEEEKLINEIIEKTWTEIKILIKK